MAIDAASITLAHGPFETVGMPGMTMAYPLADPTLMVGIKAGDKVRVTVRQTDSGLVVERVEKLGGQP
ncbi:periplasmic copper-binding protein [compost metagenome]